MIERRELFKILGAALIVPSESPAQHAHGFPADRSTAFDIANYKPRFFSEEHYRIIDDLAEIIIPADNQSPGAHAAGVPFYIDSVLHYADPETKRRWRDGLEGIDATARAQSGQRFIDCSPQQKERLVATVAGKEATPSTEIEHFFVELKLMTVEAYALSEVGMKQHFGYKGNTAIAEFVGCTHAEHQKISA